MKKTPTKHLLILLLQKLIFQILFPMHVIIRDKNHLDMNANC